MELPEKSRSLSKGILRSYSQVFFANNPFFAIILLLVSFFDPNAGLAGLISVITSVVTAKQLGFYKPEVENGLFGFNSLLVGLGIGYYFVPSLETYLIVIAASILTLFFVTLFKGILQKYGLPFLSVPFLFGIWIIMIAAGSFESLGISQKGIYTLNKLYGIGGTRLVNFYEYLSDVPMNESLKTYFNSIGAIFFQFNALAGIFIATGLLVFSRIAFLLSLYGFYIAYVFYSILGGNLEEMSYTYIGFNYVLTAIAIGGFYLIPSKKTFLWLLLLIPLVTLLTISLAKVLLVFRLPVYALPFNIVVLLFIYTLKFRVDPDEDLQEVYIQHNHPETNLYSHKNQKQKAWHRKLNIFILPFHGAWTVSQTHNGDYTHKEGWRHAVDFVITDKDNKQFSNEGNYPTDYFCFGKSVLAPADGLVEEVIDNIADNSIGKPNLIHNWGNTVIIKHDDYLYSSLNHLREDSVTVKTGQKVKKGQKIAEAGNSGRSPYPHLHMQIQSTPSVGSETIYYPLSYFIEYVNDNPRLNTFDIPKKDAKISNAETLRFLKNAFELIPGKKMEVHYVINESNNKTQWEVITDPYNQSFIFEEETKSKAYFVNDGYMLNFTGFYGNKNSVLFNFYLGFYKIFQGYYKDIRVKDEIPQNDTFRFPLLTLQDFFTPFYIFLKSEYENKIKGIDNELQPGNIEMETTIYQKFFKRKFKLHNYHIKISEEGIQYKTRIGKNDLNVKIQ